MTGDGDGGVSRVSGLVTGFLRHWAPYVGLAAAAFVASAVAGAALGAGGPSSFVPGSGAGTADAAGTFLAHLSTVALMVLGGVFVGLPTAVLLALQGYEFGGAVAALVSSIGVGEAVALVGPPALVGLPALWLAAAIPLRGLHAGARHFTDRQLSTSTERITGESALALALALAGLALAAVLAAG